MHLNFFIDLVPFFVLAVIVPISVAAKGLGSVVGRSGDTTLTSDSGGGADVRSVRLDVSRCGCSSDRRESYSIVGHGAYIDR